MTVKCAFSLAVRVLIGFFLVGLVVGFGLGLQAGAADDPVPATVTTPATETVVESVNLHRSTSGSVTD